MLEATSISEGFFNGTRNLFYKNMNKYHLKTGLMQRNLLCPVFLQENKTHKDKCDKLLVFPKNFKGKKDMKMIAQAQ